MAWGIEDRVEQILWRMTAQGAIDAFMRFPQFAENIHRKEFWIQQDQLKGILTERRFRIYGWESELEPHTLDIDMHPLRLRTNATDAEIEAAILALYR